MSVSSGVSVQYLAKRQLLFTIFRKKLLRSLTGECKWPSRGPSMTLIEVRLLQIDDEILVGLSKAKSCFIMDARAWLGLNLRQVAPSCAAKFTGFDLSASGMQLSSVQGGLTYVEALFSI